MLADGVHEAGDQQIARGPRASEKSGDEISGAFAFPIGAREARRVKKGAVGFAAVEQAFFVEAVKRGHHGGVGERAVELLDDVADARFAARPEDFHHAELEAAEGRPLSALLMLGIASLEKANHVFQIVAVTVRAMEARFYSHLPEIEKVKRNPTIEESGARESEVGMSLRRVLS